MTITGVNKCSRIEFEVCLIRAASATLESINVSELLNNSTIQQISIINPEQRQEEQELKVTFHDIVS